MPEVPVEQLQPGDVVALQIGRIDRANNGGLTITFLGGPTWQKSPGETATVVESAFIPDQGFDGPA